MIRKIIGIIIETLRREKYSFISSEDTTCNVYCHCGERVWISCNLWWLLLGCTILLVGWESYLK